MDTLSLLDACQEGCPEVLSAKVARRRPRQCELSSVARKMWCQNHNTEKHIKSQPKCVLRDGCGMHPDQLLAVHVEYFCSQFTECRWR